MVADPHAYDEDCDCLRCKLRYWREEGLQVDPRATPSRRNTKPSRYEPKNSWEKGVPTDSRGMPFLNPKTLEPIGQKEFSQRRHEIEAGRRQMRQAPPAST